jgi:hypothetical protein
MQLMYHRYKNTWSKQKQTNWFYQQGKKEVH